MTTPSRRLQGWVLAPLLALPGPSGPGQGPGPGIGSGVGPASQLEAPQEGGETVAPERELEHVLDDLLPSRGLAARTAAFEAAGRSEDARFLAPLVDLLRFADTAEEWFRILDALGAILGEDTRAIERPWRTFTERLARDTELPEFAPYARWKGELLAELVDPRFRAFLYGDVPRRIRLHEVVWGGVAVDGIPPLDDPAVLDAEAAPHLAPTAPVFGVVLNGEARAYPLELLDWHEMSNDVLGGIPIALAYCTLCGAGVVYDARTEEEPRRFSSSGLLMRSNKLMYDRATESLWNQLTGEPVTGPLADSGIRLAVLPSVVTTWGEWRDRQPETTVLDPDTGFERDYRIGASYGAYFASADTMFPAARPGSRGDGAGRPAKERVFVVRLQSGAATFALEDLAARGIAHAAVAGERVVVVPARGKRVVPLDARWSELLDGSDGQRARTADELSLADLERAWRAIPERFEAEFLLALDPLVRTAFFEWVIALDERSGLARFPLELRDEVAVRALVGEVRAFDAGAHRFRRTSDPAVLLDADGRAWTVTERALTPADSSDDSSPPALSRLPGHLAFRFGWEAFETRD